MNDAITAIADTVPDARSRHQRVDGHARIAFGANGISDLYQRAPCRLLFPDGADGDGLTAVSITTSGGLTGGDRVALDIIVDDHACGIVTTQAADKLYRVLPDDPDIKVNTSITVGRGASCQWLSQEAILFDRTRMRRTLHADLALDARLFAVETVVLGRGAMGETFRQGLVHDSWRIRRGDRLEWADTLHVDGRFDRIAAEPYGFGGARALATLLYTAPDAADYLHIARDLAQPPFGGATCFDGLLILRMLRDDPQQLRRDVVRAASVLRAAALGTSPNMPALWYC
ncbi:urease accessory protein UreD [Sphingobium algorifonticola]|uniref:Urease accessory protein UreD n=1 Tax=Sphingobium algorifonticola TaxID=2008318 RepID=A0A437J6N7_9SPHN|nr:urease accessory protein UreD [Sphingobium algorifonticola]RVT40734.1 urease accessory protein UreD [Sphingobium algorifonticola]